MNMNAPLEIGLCVADLPRMLAFYEGLLGMRRISEIALNAHGAQISGLGHSGYTVVRLQTPYGERIKLVCPQPAAVAGNPPRPSDTPTSRTGLAYLTFLVEAMEPLLADLDRAGFASVKGIVELRPGVRMALVRDPEGNWIEFAEYANIAAYRPDLVAGPR